MTLKLTPLTKPTDDEVSTALSHVSSACQIMHDRFLVAHYAQDHIVRRIHTQQGLGAFKRVLEHMALLERAVAEDVPPKGAFT